MSRPLDESVRVWTMPAVTMRKRSRRSEQFRRAGESSVERAPDALAAAATIPARPWHDGAWLPLCSAVLLSLAFAPISQFYLAWIGLVPWLLFVRRAPTARRLFLWNWLAGTLFAAVNIWWLCFVTIPGTLGSVVYMGLYWGIAALVVRVVWGEGGWWRVEGGGRAKRASSSTLYSLLSTLSPFIVAAIWTGCEWVRGNLLTGWPWSFLGYTQTPALAMCQVADVAGVYGVTFWLVAVNALVAQFVLARFKLAPVMRSLVAVVALLAIVLVYGIARLATTHTTPGPRVMVVQSNFPQSNTGAKGATMQQLVDFHVDTTTAALAAEQSAGRKVDLVVWSETMMPPLNADAREALVETDLGKFLDDTYNRLSSLAFNFRTALLTGGEYIGRVTPDGDRFRLLEPSNAAYLFEPTGTLSDLRYDKIHLVPFGEYVPFKESFPPLYQFFMWFSPYDFDYNLVPGADDALTVFSLSVLTGEPTTHPATEPYVDPDPAASPATAPATQPAQPSFTTSHASRFVGPICFEDADPRLLARMFDGGGGEKRADFIVNITNDGWFSQPQLSQHLQIARFRSIENRVPTARSVNTGISAFIDSTGRVIDRLPAHAPDTLIATLPLDPRIALYTRLGDAFAICCALVTGVIGSIGIVRWRRARQVVL
jgi:apolipoprotein N-acyltransferase